MEINGIPAHPLVIHAAVVLTPLAALAAVASVVPRWRAALRWPLVVLAVLSMVSVQLAVITGEDLLDTRGPDSPLIETHEERAELLRNVMIGFTLLALAVGVVIPRRSRVEAGSSRGGGALATGLTVVTALVGIAVIVLVVLTGDAGAESVWG